MLALRQVLTEARSSNFWKVGTSTSFVARAFSQRTIGSQLLKSAQSSQTTSVTTPNASISALGTSLLRSYATTTRKSTTKRTTTKRKTAVKKKPKKKPKKKVAKKKVAKKPKKPAKPTRPKVMNLPSPRGLSPYAVFLSERVKTATAQRIVDRFREVSAAWKSLSDAEKEVFPFLARHR
jgi:hypothetical protein